MANNGPAADANSRPSYDQVVSSTDTLDILRIVGPERLEAEVYTRLLLDELDISNATLAHPHDPRARAKYLIHLWCNRYGTGASRGKLFEAMMGDPDCYSSLTKLKIKWGYQCDDSRVPVKAVDDTFLKLTTVLSELNLDEDLFAALKATNPAVISDEDHQEINAIPTQELKVDRLIGKLKKKPLEVLSSFLFVLWQKDLFNYGSNQNHTVLSVLLINSWELKFVRICELANPREIQILPYGDVAVSNSNHIAIHSKNGGASKHSFNTSSDTLLSDFSITQNNRLILPGKNKIQTYEPQYTYASADNVTSDVNNKPSNPIALAVDPSGQIIVGLEGNTISIHHADGHFISKFPTHATPRSIDVTSNGDIAVVFNDNTLHLMDYNGKNVRVVQRPQGVKKWKPWRICCSKQGEIFVVDRRGKAVYQYTADGQCVGSVISGLDSPRGIAITADGEQLYVVEYKQSVVKIFQKYKYL